MYNYTICAKSHPCFEFAIEVIVTSCTAPMKYKCGWQVLIISWWLNVVHLINIIIKCAWGCKCHIPPDMHVTWWVLVQIYFWVSTVDFSSLI